LHAETHLCALRHRRGPRAARAGPAAAKAAGAGPGTGLDTVHGIDAIRPQLTRVVRDLRLWADGQLPSSAMLRSALLAGPPGTGKTTTAWEFLQNLLENILCSRPMRFDMICGANGIEHRLTKPNHPWTNGQVERMNRTTPYECICKVWTSEPIDSSFTPSTRCRDQTPGGTAWFARTLIAADS